jgi:hypothetical protein
VSTEPPTDVLTERLQHAVRGRPITAAVFTTFRFEPGFFEQEILTALFDIPWHHVPKLRKLQFEELLRPVSGRLAVYYDHGALVEGDLGSPSLDIRRIPCYQRTGYFHPKVIFVVVEDAAGPALVTMTGSANLTRAGWWENVESAAIEELREGDSSRMRDGLVAFTEQLRRQTAAVREHEALDAVRSFFRGVTQKGQRSSGGRLHTHFYSNGRGSAQSVSEFIAEATRGTVVGWNLDVISPYVDETDRSRPLEELARVFRPRSVRVLIPEHDGAARLPPSLYESVRANGWAWGRLPPDLTSGGQDARAAVRVVHAKVYRFFAGEREIIFVGSVNLTNAGHQAGGNAEAGVLFERRPRQRLRHWLTPIDEAPAFFSPTREEEGFEAYAPRLVIRYDWSSQAVAALWEASSENPRLRLRAHGVDLFEIEQGALPTRQWQDLVEVHVETLEEQLRASSFLTAVTDEGREGVLLVLEIGMAHRPSLLLDLTPAEILQYWALLTADQRAQYLGERGEGVNDLEGAESLVSGRRDNLRPESMFDRFAGMFKGFASLERKVISALEDRRPAEAEFLVVGKKPDSLRRLVDRVADRTSVDTRLEDYLLLLCAEQLVHHLRQDWPAFWKGTRGTSDLEEAFSIREDLRVALVEATDPDMALFLRWHEKKFLQPVKRP